MTFFEILLFIIFLILICLAAFAIKDTFHESIVQQDMPLNKHRLLEAVPDENDDCEMLMKQCEDVYKFCRG